MGGREAVPPRDAQWAEGAEGWGGGAPWRELDTLLTHSPRPACGLRSSGIVLNVVFNFIPEVLLVPQMMLCGFNIQWVIEIQKVSKQRV